MTTKLRQMAADYIVNAYEEFPSLAETQYDEEKDLFEAGALRVLEMARKISFKQNKDESLSICRTQVLVDLEKLEEIFK